MAASKSAVLFDDIIQADRLRRKNEALANEIFGKGRIASTQSNGNRKSGFNKTNIASRGGIAKASQRAGSSTPKNVPTDEGAWGHDLHHVINPPTSRASRRENPMLRNARNDRLYEAATSQSPRDGNSHEAEVEADSKEISIRGTATGPYLVIGSNFAPGTTAADIQSAMVPSGGEMQSCKVTSYLPTVTAEMVFAEKASADSVIATFNNKKADGRILNVYIMRQGKPNVPIPVQQAPNEPETGRANLIDANPIRNDSTGVDPSYNNGVARVDPPRNDSTPVDPARNGSTRIDLTRNNLTGVDSSRNGSARVDIGRKDSIRTDPPRADLSRPDAVYNAQREQSDRSRRRADPEFQDGSYGFDSSYDRMDVDMDDRRDSWHNDQREGLRERDRARSGGLGRENRRLYSDDLYQRPRGRGYR